GGVEGAAERLCAALHEADHERERPEVPGLADEVAEDGDDCVDAEREVDAAARPDAHGEGAEQEAERDADELDEEQSADEGSLPEAELGPVDHCEPLDRVDPVDVEPEREQELERLAVLADLAERLAQPAEGDGDGVGAERFAGLHASGRLGHVAEDRDGEDEPPDRDAEEGYAAGDA